jgi:hypothetical protein
MKRRTTRQLVRLLSDIRHSAHCTTLRAAAVNRAIEQAVREAEEEEASDQQASLEGFSEWSAGEHHEIRH